MPARSSLCCALLLLFAQIAGPADFAAGADAAPKANFVGQPFEYARGSLNEQEDRADTPRTGKVVLCLAGDSTVTYSQGYAAGLRARFDPQLQVINRSRGGRTTSSFRNDGRWADVLKIKPDYVMIQFGHNDGRDLVLYEKNLRRFIDEARAAGIKPILVTPVSRRYWQEDGTIKDDLIEKVAVMHAIAADTHVPLMELHERAVELYLKMGRKVSDAWGLPKPDPAHPGVTILDKTHFNAEGSRAMGKVAADELKRAVPELAPYIE
jgi:lysophospholipase L1-like esterase